MSSCIGYFGVTCQKYLTKKKIIKSMKSEGNSNVTGHYWLTTATAREHSVIEAKVKVMWNCSIVVICNWFVSILCPLLSLLCRITNHIHTGPMANSFICSLFDKFLSVLQHFFRGYKLNHLQTLHSLCLWKQSIIIIGNTIRVIINFALHGKLKGVVITLHHKFCLLWE